MLETNQPAQAVEVLAPLREEYPDDHASSTCSHGADERQSYAEAQLLLDRILSDGESANRLPAGAKRVAA